jgi:Flp pilus assembly protein TadG
MHWFARVLNDVAGSALVEGAVLTPFLCTLFFGVFEFSYIFYQQHLMTTGVSDAARYVSRSCNPTATATTTIAQNLATTGTTAGGAYRRITGWNPAGVPSTTSTIPPAPTADLRPFQSCA